MNDTEKLELIKKVLEGKIEILEQRNSRLGYHQGRLDLAYEILTIIEKES